MWQPTTFQTQDRHIVLSALCARTRCRCFRILHRLRVYPVRLRSLGFHLPWPYVSYYTWITPFTVFTETENFSCPTNFIWANVLALWYSADFICFALGSRVLSQSIFARSVPHIFNIAEHPKSVYHKQPWNKEWQSFVDPKRWLMTGYRLHVYVTSE